MPHSSANTVQHDDDQAQGWANDDSSSSDEPDHNDSASILSAATTIAMPTNLNQQTPPAKSSKQKGSAQPDIEAAIELKRQGQEEEPAGVGGANA
ncbi:hypothetical protein BGZ76_004251 [Entomortierella beljakovae]|nr:hypothetical protein BGZ76_004251 [Entomortierella beljakovae]